MANLLDNISIKNKIIFALFITLFISLGIGVVQLNKIIKIQNNYYSRKVLTIFKTDYLELQNLYYKLDAIVVKISNSGIDEEIYVKSINDYKSVNLEILMIFENLKGINIFEVADLKTVDFLSSFNDSLYRYNSLYIGKIQPSVDKLIEYKYLVLHPEKVQDEYKKLVSEQQDIGNIIIADENFVSKEEIIIQLLDAYKNSSDDLAKFLSNRLASQTFSIDKMLYNIQEEINRSDSLIDSARSGTVRISIILFTLTILFILLISFLISNSIVNPLLEANQILSNLSQGIFSKVDENDRADEVGLILESLDELIAHLVSTSKFAKNISTGNFEYKFIPSGSKDVLGNSLLQLRESLLQAKKDEDARQQEDFVRSRTAEGLAKFSDILRLNQNNIKNLGREVMSALVKFLNSNQGVIFLLNEDEEETYLELLSAYAWNREKFYDKKLKIGEALIGAVADEKFTVYMEDVPEDYIEIKSGTGSANPTSILIVPLKIDNEVLGVVELASFNTFDKYEIELVEKIAESIASTLNSVRISAQTAELLEKFKIQASEMKEQEYAMKSTIEDLHKTSVQRKENESRLEDANKEMEDLYRQLQYKDEQLKTEIKKLTNENNEKLLLIKQSQKQSREILESMLTSVIIIKKGGKIDFVNKATEILLNYDKMYILDKNIEDVIMNPLDIGDSKLCEYLFTNQEKFKQDGGLEIVIKLESGKTQTVVLELMILEAKKQEDMRMVLFLKDMSKLQQKSKDSSIFVEKLAKNDLENVMKIDYYQDVIFQNNIKVAEFVLDKKILLKWSSKFELGISLIDGQHKRWIEFINLFYESLTAKKDFDELSKVFKKLLDYTDYHFGFEEKYLNEFKFDEIIQHSTEHEEFVNELTSLFSDYIEGRVDSVYNLILMLRKWVINHVLVTDKKYVELFKKHGIR